MGRRSTEKHLQFKPEALAKRVLKSLRAGNSFVDVIILPGRDLARLKARFARLVFAEAKRAGTTARRARFGLKTKGKEPDVLAFPEPKNFPHPEKKGKKFLGEVYLNRDIVRSDWERASFLLIHGILHLLGFSHDKKRDMMKMEGMERKLMSNLKFKNQSGK